MNKTDCNKIMNDRSEGNCWHCKHSNRNHDVERGIIAVYCLEGKLVILNEDIVEECILFEEG